MPAVLSPEAPWLSRDPRRTQKNLCNQNHTIFLEGCEDERIFQKVYDMKKLQFINRNIRSFLVSEESWLHLGLEGNLRKSNYSWSS